MGPGGMITAESIAKILGLDNSIRSLASLDTVVTAGLPKRSLERLAIHLYPNMHLAREFCFRVVPASTLRLRTKRLSATESQRTERLARVLATANFVLDDMHQARAWVKKPHRELGNKTPLDTAFTEIGARRVEAILAALFFGLPR